ncbi:MAG: outer membrane beta-barrel protein [Pseudomonadota bacterium]
MTFNMSAVARCVAIILSAGLISTTGESEAYAAEGTYLNGSITRIDDDRFDLDAFTTRAGWNFSKYFGVEGELSLPTGEDQQGFTTFELSHVLGVFGTARLELSDSFELFARTGLIDSQVDVRIDVQNEAFTVDQNSAAIGAGVNWFPTKNFGMRAGYTYAKSDTFDAGIVIRF